MCSYFPNTVEPCRKPIRDRELIRTFVRYLLGQGTYTQHRFIVYVMYHMIMVTKVKYGRVV